MILASLLGCTSAFAQPLVVCTEASPEGFDIVQYTAATTADASAETVFKRLVAVRPRQHPRDPGAGRELGGQRRRTAATPSPCARA